MKKNDVVYLRHILDAVNQIQEYVNSLDYTGFTSSRLVQDGVVRQLEIIGEATKNLSDELRDRHADIQWKDIAGMRDKLIHHYFGVDMDAVWESVEQDIPILKAAIQSILNRS